MRVLVLGGGQVAQATAACVPPAHEVTALRRAQLDIVDSTAVHRTVSALAPDWIVNAAAYTAVDRAEDEVAEAVAVNDTAVETLALAAQRAGSRLLQLSTDFVFDGRSHRAYLPADTAKPLNVYGASKLAGEGHVLAQPSGIVLRTSWVYASVGRNFVLTMLRLMRDKAHLTVVGDQIGTPTWSRSLAAAIWGLIDANAEPGIYHWSDLGLASWYDFAVAIQDESLGRGILQERITIEPVCSAQYPTRAARPAFSVLDTSATRARIKIAANHWRHNLGAMLDELRPA